MLPDNKLSTLSQPSTIIGGRRFQGGLKTDFESGPIAFSDTSQGLYYQVWYGQAFEDRISLWTDTVDKIQVVSGTNITELSFTFDQNGRPSVLYLQYGLMKLFWYDSSLGGEITTTFSTGNISPKIFLDDKRGTQSGNSDMIIGYIRNTNLYYRQQRDRFLVEYLLARDVIGRLERFGMGRNLRLQFVCGHY